MRVGPSRSLRILTYFYGNNHMRSSELLPYANTSWLKYISTSREYLLGAQRTGLVMMSLIFRFSYLGVGICDVE